jgi:hypothetical protein
MNYWHIVLYVVTLAFALTAVFFQMRIREEMQDSLDWHSPDAPGFVGSMFRDVVRQYEKKYPTSSLPRRFRWHNIISICMMLVLVIEVIVLQSK